jgi:hypothetical protein
MTETAFILRRLSILLTLHQLTRFSSAPAAGSAKSLRRIVPLQVVSYSGFSLPISIIPQTPRPKLGGWISRVTSAVQGALAMAKEKCVASAFGRVLLHCACLARDGRLRWHWAGIVREFQAPCRARLAAPRGLPAC